MNGVDRSCQSNGGLSCAGRPVDVQPLLDGSLLISDELAGAVYRVTYNKTSNPNGI